MADMHPVTIIIIEKALHHRKAIKSAISMIRGAEMAGMFEDLASAVETIRHHKPQLIVLSYELNQEKTDKAISKIKSIVPECEIVLTSETHKTRANTSFKALDLGALYFIRKMKDTSHQDNVLYYQKYLMPIVNLYRVTKSSEMVKQNRKQVKPRPNTIKPPSNLNLGKAPGKIDLVLIGASLGGPDALNRFIPFLPADFPVPILIVQHMPSKFTTSMSESLDARSKLIVREGANGEIIRPGYVYVAPGGYHMKLSKLQGSYGQYLIMLKTDSPLHGCRPAVDATFISTANCYEGNILAIVLTGMGHDGTDGVRLLKEKTNCFCITQSEESCTVYGMPMAVDKAGLSDLSIPIDKMAEVVNRLIISNTKSVSVE